MSDPYRKVQRGQRLSVSARVYNHAVDLFRQGEDGGAAAGGLRTAQTGIVLVKNGIGANLGRFSVLGIDGPLFMPDVDGDDFQRAAAFSGVTPAEEHEGKFVVLAEPLDVDQIGRAYVAGCFPAMVNVIAEADEFADVNPGVTTSLKSTSSGAAKIIWKESGTGEKLAIVLVGGGGGGGGESIGSEQEQVHKMLTQNTGGWDYIATHA